jgi:hypothetical protein
MAFRFVSLSVLTGKAHRLVWGLGRCPAKVFMVGRREIEGLGALRLVGRGF